MCGTVVKYLSFYLGYSPLLSFECVYLFMYLSFIYFLSCCNYVHHSKKSLLFIIWERERDREGVREREREEGKEREGGSLLDGTCIYMWDSHAWYIQCISTLVWGIALTVGRLTSIMDQEENILIFIGVTTSWQDWLDYTHADWTTVCVCVCGGGGGGGGGRGRVNTPMYIN